jgi:hypothetical protein
VETAVLLSGVGCLESWGGDSPKVITLVNGCICSSAMRSRFVGPARPLPRILKELRLLRKAAKPHRQPLGRGQPWLE